MKHEDAEKLRKRKKKNQRKEKKRLVIKKRRSEFPLVITEKTGRGQRKSKLGKRKWEKKREKNLQRNQSLLGGIMKRRFRIISRRSTRQRGVFSKEGGEKKQKPVEGGHNERDLKIRKIGPRTKMPWFPVG